MELLTDAWFDECLPLLDGDIRSLLWAFVERLRCVEDGNLLLVVLYGSMARGDFDEESDIDLFVVLRTGDGSHKEDWISAAAGDVEAELMNSCGRLSPFVETLEHLACETDDVAHWWLDPIFESVRRDGVILYDDGGADLDELPDGPQELKTSIVVERLMQCADREIAAAISCFDDARPLAVDLAFRAVRYSLQALLRRFDIKSAGKYNFHAESALFGEHFVPDRFSFEDCAFLRDLQRWRDGGIYCLMGALPFGKALDLVARSRHFVGRVAKTINSTEVR